MQASGNLGTGSTQPKWRRERQWPGLEELARLHGVATHFIDWQRRRRRIHPFTLRAVLRAMGVRLDNPDAVGPAIEAAKAQAGTQVIAPSWVVRQKSPRDVPLNLPKTAQLEAWIELDNDPALATVGGRIELDWSADQASGQLPSDLPLGWHRLCLRLTPGQLHTSALVVCPSRLVLPKQLRHTSCWGVMVQLYSVRSKTSWGLGDLADLAQLGRILGRKTQAGFIQINPIHAGEVVTPLTQSPYRPSSRDFIHPIYIRPQATEEYRLAPPKIRRQVNLLAKQAASLGNQSSELDRDAVWAYKSQALELLHQQPRSRERSEQLTAFVAKSTYLDDFALFNVLSEVGLAEVIDHGSERARQFAARQAGRLDYHRWLQMVASEQLALAHQACLDAGMAVGLILDLAVGVHPDGADAWSRRSLLAQGVEVGAPPDYFNQIGQGWAQPPWRPDALAAAGYLPLRSMLRAVLTNAGALRIDHILGLFRLWWIPAFASPAQGTYVSYDHEAMTSVLLLEAKRA
ncbi:MAG: 4-alpha-glucanotransferase, partial [Micrococcales bacterium]|nr:4-alpha-glucanotransferase [Micrococcales bacterium]